MEPFVSLTWGFMRVWSSQVHLFTAGNGECGSVMNICVQSSITKLLMCCKLIREFYHLHLLQHNLKPVYLVLMLRPSCAGRVHPVGSVSRVSLDPDGRRPHRLLTSAGSGCAPYSSTHSHQSSSTTEAEPKANPFLATV